MIEPTTEQKLVMIPVLCQLLVEFIEETSEGPGSGTIYRQKLKYHAKGLIEDSDKFLAAVYGYARTINHADTMAEDQNTMALQLKEAMATGIIIE